MKRNREKIWSQRDRMVEELPQIPRVSKFLGGSDSNFLLIEILDKPRNEGGRPSNETAMAVYERLADAKGAVARFRGMEFGCLGCMRITVGTAEEVDKLLERVQFVLTEILSNRSRAPYMDIEHVKEHEANDVIA